METRIDNGQSGRDPHPENDSNLANFHFISSLSRRHDMSALRSVTPCHECNASPPVLRQPVTCDPGRADKRERGELRPVPGIILGLRAADQGLSQAVRGLESNLRISKLLCLKLGRREGLEVVSSVSCLGCVRLTRADI